MTGLILVDKPAGITSMDVVSRMRRILHITKIGHTGTLDPDATGVLPICIGRATKAVEILMNGNIKEYRAVMLLGRTTDTLDTSGTEPEVPEETKAARQAVIAGLSEADIQNAAEGFLGDIMQIPPMFSAVKIQGKKLVDLARKGVEIERSERPVSIYEIEIERVELPRVTMRIRCSKGTYIRTLCADMGEKLGCGACMESLVRTETDGFKLEECISLDELEMMAKAEEGDGDVFERLESVFIPVDRLFMEAPGYKAFPSEDRFAERGNMMRPEDFEGLPEDMEKQGLKEPFPMIRVYLSDGEFCALYEWRPHRHYYMCYKMFRDLPEGE